MGTIQLHDHPHGLRTASEAVPCKVDHVVRVVLPCPELSGEPPFPSLFGLSVPCVLFAAGGLAL